MGHDILFQYRCAIRHLIKPFTLNTLPRCIILCTFCLLSTFQWLYMCIVYFLFDKHRMFRIFRSFCYIPNERCVCAYSNTANISSRYKGVCYFNFIYVKCWLMDYYAFIHSEKGHICHFYLNIFFPKKYLNKSELNTHPI